MLVIFWDLDDTIIDTREQYILEDIDQIMADPKRIAKLKIPRNTMNILITGRSYQHKFRMMRQLRKANIRMDKSIFSPFLESEYGASDFLVRYWPWKISTILNEKKELDQILIDPKYLAVDDDATIISMINRLTRQKRNGIIKTKHISKFRRSISIKG